MKKLLFATSNTHKLNEIREITVNKFDVLGLNDLKFDGEIPETSPTIEGNAIQKARFIHDKFLLDCFADDTGLEVDALNGEPGVYSARYAGEHCSYFDNNVKLLAALQNESNKKARFRTVIALIYNNQLYTFEGVVEGKIVPQPKGNEGFGYDPVFVPEGYNQTFAEMISVLKNTISHRGLATAKLMSFLDEMIK
jgi:XTP/dITP diphosphohydrolase